ncbi:type II toxin-antitoxin system HicB family antitoxin [Anaerococcus sp. AGMB09787]|uniref:type II toxin-antitoxin system HicB family antitoxin n=1 Tax=Anaerococcus sp. AGMB09787 TaxID=2922869 RepID=UPI001FB02B9F|nr:type II toxin-antitoxin system HicB family antitoxin [Anaerococcus sp. AGMB09787]
MYVVYPAIFYKDKESGYTVVFPDFDGGATCGDNQQDAFYMAQDWLGCVLYDYYVENKEFPKSSNVEDIVIEDDEYAIKEESFVTLVGLDIVDYVKKVDKKTVKKNVTIPSYLNEMGKNMNINFSKVLTEALEKEFDID